jgi:hypothetical protein
LKTSELQFKLELPDELVLALIQIVFGYMTETLEKIKKAVSQRKRFLFIEHVTTDSSSHVLA